MVKTPKRTTSPQNRLNRARLPVLGTPHMHVNPSLEERRQPRRLSGRQAAFLGFELGHDEAVAAHKNQVGEPGRVLVTDEHARPHLPPRVMEMSDLPAQEPGQLNDRFLQA